MDTGLLNLWSSDRAPLVPPGVLSPELTRVANSAVDLQITGADAALASQALGLQPWTHGYICDIPKSGLSELRTKFKEATRSRNLRASLEVLPSRLPHRARVDLTLAHSPAGIVQFHGIWAAACAGIPRNKSLKVVGHRMPEGSDFSDSWQRVYLEVSAEGVVAASVRAGDVMVDRARLMFVDVDSLRSWEHERSLDGLADFVFWGGADAEVASRKLRVPALEDGQFGWRNIAVDEAVRLGTAVETVKQRGGMKFATDFRPHSHHHLVMEQIRSTPTSSASLEVGGARLCAFHTSWGDGCFPVFRDLDSTGQLLRLRIELGGDEN